MIQSALLFELALQYAAVEYTVGLSIVAAVTFVLTVAILRKREQRIALLLGTLLGVTAIWCLAYGLQLASTDIATARFWNGFRLLCSPVVSLLVFLFAAEYTGREQWLRPRRVLALSAVPALTAGLILTNHAHHLVRGAMIRSEGDLFVGSTIGPARLAYGLWDFLLVAAAIGMLLLAFHRSEHIYRSQVATMVVGVTIPAVVNVANFFDLVAADFTPIGFALSGLMFAVALYRFRLLDIRPIARSTVFETVDAGVLVVDRDGRIVDANEAAGALVDDSGSYIGRDVASLVEGITSPAFATRLEGDREFRDRVELTTAGTTRWYDVSVSPIHDDTSQYLGRLVMFTDVTDREHRRRTLAARTRELERQNEHLERVTSFASHDLRNPLTVAHGHLELARESDDPAHLDVLEDSLDRMDRLVSQMLEMAREGQAVTDAEPVPVDDVAAEAWRGVDTAGATINVDVEKTVVADRDLLLRVFENLFRNATEHGRTDDSGSAEALVVRVGAIDSGFFVEDSGPGVPEDRRGDVFEQGYSTGDDGVGLGLAIVQSTVRAHGWSVDLTTGTDGGARFEIVTDRPADRDDVVGTSDAREGANVAKAGGAETGDGVPGSDDGADPDLT